MFGFFKKKIKAKREDFNLIVKDLQKNISQVHTIFGNEIIEIVNEIPPEDKFGSQTFFAIPLYEAIFGYQITCLIGFTSREGLISIMDNLELKELLLTEISNETGLDKNSIKGYDNLFLSCSGNIECLNNEFFNLVCKICSIDKNSPSAPTIKKKLENKSTVLAIETQKNTALAFGSNDLVNQLDKVLNENSYN